MAATETPPPAAEKEPTPASSGNEDAPKATEKPKEADKVETTDGGSSKPTGAAEKKKGWMSGIKEAVGSAFKGKKKAVVKDEA